MFRLVDSSDALQRLDELTIASKVEAPRSEDLRELVAHWRSIRETLVDTSRYEEGVMRPKALDAFIICLPEDALRARGLLQELLSRCDTVRLCEEAVLALRDHCKERFWGILCPKCEVPGAPKWVRQKNRVLGGTMQCSHTGEAGKTTNHGGWSTVRDDIMIVERPELDFTTRLRDGGRFALKLVEDASPCYPPSTHE